MIHHGVTVGAAAQGGIGDVHVLLVLQSLVTILMNL